MSDDEQIRQALLAFPVDENDLQSDEEADNILFTFSNVQSLPRKRCANFSACSKPNRSQLICACCILLTTLSVTLGVVFFMNFTALLSLVYPISNTATVGDNSWQVELERLTCTSPVRVYDVDADGVKDIVIGVNYDKQPIEDHAVEGCRHALLALNGKDGSILWHICTNDEVFELRCPAIDVNRDGVMDCIASGRNGTLLAFNPLNKSVLWTAPAEINVRWNVFAPGVVEDVNGDGVEDLVVINGGDPKYAPEERNRTASEMFLLSGRTGETIGNRSLIMVDGKESYSLPMIYTCEDRSQYIVYGTGGETVSGALYILSLKHLLSHVCPPGEYNLTGGYSYWTNREHHQSGLITLHKTATKGVMVPASFVDINNDGVKDIVALTFDGILLTFSGVDLSYLWTPKNFTIGPYGTESYTSPAFGYFNGDDTLDIMVLWQTGRWPVYDSLMIYVIDGRNGDILWYKDTPNIYDYTVSSPIVMSTDIPYRDAFIVRVSSTNRPFLQKRSQAHTSKKTGKRHIGMHTTGINSCEEMEGVYIDTLVVDRTNSKSPLLLYRQSALPFYYNVTEELVGKRIREESASGHHMSRKKRHGDGDTDEDYSDVLNTVRCIRLNPWDLSTGLLTDTEGDGVLDYISVEVVLAKLTIRDDEVTAQLASKTVVRKISIGHRLPHLKQLKLNEVVSAVSSNNSEIPLANISLATLENQRWSQHLGTSQDGSY